MVGYALLIAMALSLSLLVYAWLKAYTPGAVEPCPDDVAIVLADISCDNAGNTMNLTLQNKGLFNIYGFYIKASNSTGIPIYNLKNASGAEDDIFNQGVVRAGSDFRSNEKRRWVFNYSHINRVNKIEIEPFISRNSEEILCTNAAITEEVNCA